MTSFDNRGRPVVQTPWHLHHPKCACVTCQVERPKAEEAKRRAASRATAKEQAAKEGPIVNRGPPCEVRGCALPKSVCGHDTLAQVKSIAALLNAGHIKIPGSEYKKARDTDAYDMRFMTYGAIRPQMRNVLPALMLDDPDPYAAGRIRERALMKEGGGLASRFKDTTPAAKMSQEPVTCDVGADWDD